MSSDPTPDAGVSADDPEDAEVTPYDAADAEATPSETDGATPCAYTDYVEGEGAEAYPATGEDAEGLAADVWAVLHDVDDPEMPISIVDLGLIYGVAVEEPAGEDAGAHVDVRMTLTYTGCPARKYLTEEIEARVATVDGVESVDLDLVWSPPWTLEMVTERGEQQLREFGLSI